MRPDLRVSADGRDITDVVLDRFVSVALSDLAEEEADTFELGLDDRRPGIAVPPTGAVLDVELGFVEEGTARMGSYTVSEVEYSGPPAALTVRAHAANMLGELKAPRTRSWTLHTIGDVVGTIAGRHGLEPRVDPALRGIALPHIDQVDESDLSLLRRLASYQLDVVAKVTNGRLVFLRRQVLANELAAAATRIERTEGLDYRMLRADRSMYVAVIARWRAFSAAALEEVRAGDPGGPAYTLPDTYPDVSSATNAAETKLRALQRGTRTGALTLSPGRPGLAADAPVELVGWGAALDGVWVANTARHAISEDGYRTTLDIEVVTEPWERAAWEPPPENPFAGATASLGRAVGGAVPGGGGSGGGAPAPNMAHVVARVAALYPDALRRVRADWEFMDRVVAALREVSPRWGFNCKRGNCNVPVAFNAVAYYRGAEGGAAGSTDVALVEVVVGGATPNPRPGWSDTTAVTAANGEVGRWKYPR